MGRWDIKRRRLSWLLEGIWWIFSVLVAALVVYPIVKKVPDYPFLSTNLIFVFALLTFSRYTFLWKSFPLHHIRILKFTLLVATIPIALWLFKQIQLFQLFLDDLGLHSILLSLNDAEQVQLASYIRTEMLLFGTGAIISTVALAVRMIISLWRGENQRGH